MTLAERHAEVVNALTVTGTPVVSGPPFTHPPDGPCYAVSAPNIRGVYGTSGECRIVATTVEVVCVPQSGDDLKALMLMADTATAVLGGQVAQVDIDVTPFDNIDTFVYRLTLED